MPLDVAVGDKVIYSKYGGTEVKVEGQEYLILSARDVLAVLSSNQACGPGFTRARRRRAPVPLYDEGGTMASSC